MKINDLLLNSYSRKRLVFVIYYLLQIKKEMSAMSRGKSHFQSKWLEGSDSNGDQISSYMTKNSEFSVKCSFCSKMINTDNAGKSAIVRHYQSKGHRNIANLRAGRSSSQMILSLGRYFNSK